MRTIEREKERLFRCVYIYIYTRETRRGRLEIFNLVNAALSRASLFAFVSRSFVYPLWFLIPRSPSAFILSRDSTSFSLVLSLSFSPASSFKIPLRPDALHFPLPSLLLCSSSFEILVSSHPPAFIHSAYPAPIELSISHIVFAAPFLKAALYSTSPFDRCSSDDFITAVSHLNLERKSIAALVKQAIISIIISTGKIVMKYKGLLNSHDGL